MIEDQRIKNLQEQVRILRKNQENKIPKALYQKRDFVTGKRLLFTGAGASYYFNYLSNSQPNSLLTSVDYQQQTVNQLPVRPKTI